MAKTKHIGKNLRNIRLLKGLKQETFARELGIAQQNVSKMEKKKDISLNKLEAAAKVLGVSVEAIEKFNEKVYFNNNIALEEHAGQIVHPVKEVIEYFKDELLKKDNTIREKDKKLAILEAELAKFKGVEKKSSKQNSSGITKSLHSVSTKKEVKAIQ